jgi:hypothetical protein
VPEAAYVVSVVLDVQTFAGGLLQVTPMHGSALHAPFAQPNGQLVSVGA